jgi:hypothetical protein
MEINILILPKGFKVTSFFVPKEYIANQALKRRRSRTGQTILEKCPIQFLIILMKYTTILKQQLIISENGIR